jgi:CBS-domain-containing membrane protein
MDAETTINDKFRRLWKYYFLQSLLASAVIALLVLVLGEEKTVLIGAMGATTFIVFALPTTYSAHRRNITGGHLVGLATGAVFYYAALPYFVGYPLAVGTAIFIMVALDVEHPPAAGTALAVITNEVTCDTAIAIMISAVVLSQCQHYLKHYLKDLL